MAKQIPEVNFATAEKIVLAAVKTNQPVLLLGDPGIGKSALATKVARELDLPLRTLLGSTVDPTDVGGLPVVVDGVVDRVPLKAIRDAANSPCLLFLDEISAAPLPVQAAFLRLILERVAGDVTLHPDSRIIAACNPPEQAPGGFDLSAPLVGRMCLLTLRPAATEVLDYLSTIGDMESEDKYQQSLGKWFSTFAAVAAHTPNVLQIDIPSSCVSGGIPWGAPRSWERGLRMLASDGLDARASSAMLAGNVGESAAIAFLAVWDLIDKLPTVEEIVEDPKKAKMPEDPHQQVAVLGILASVAVSNVWAAYLYASRLRKEYSMAALKMLQKFKGDARAKWAKEGIEARVEMTKQIKRFSEKSK